MSNQKVNLAHIQSKIITRGRNGKTKKTKSLFDTPLEDRTYWGNDPGSEINFHLARSAIRKQLSFGIIFDVEDDNLTRVLNKEYREELAKYQMILLSEMSIDREIIIVKNDEDQWIIQWVL